MTAAEFIVLFPEFSAAPTALIESRIAWALLRTPVGIWGDYQEQGLSLLTAHFLAQHPAAKDMRKGEKPGETMYLAERQRLERIVGSSAATRLAGLPSTPTSADLTRGAGDDGL